MWSARASFAGDVGDATVLVSSAALVLPAVVVATLVAGAAAGLAAASRFARPASSAARTVSRRMIFGAAGGAVIGVAAAAVILFTFGVNTAIGVIAATVGVAALLAGLSAGLAAAPLAAGIAATLGVFICGALLNLFQSRLKSLLGEGATIVSRTDAADRYFYLSAFVSGLVAMVVAYLYLRRRESGRGWGWYLLAGATPGLVALFGELVTRVGGNSLFSVVGGFSDNDRAVLNYVSGSRFVSGMLIVFVGGIGAMILVGRTLRRPAESGDVAGPNDPQHTRADAPSRTGRSRSGEDEVRLAGSRGGDERFDVDFDDELLDEPLDEASDDVSKGVSEAASDEPAGERLEGAGEPERTGRKAD
jgi:hypothetical protein